MPITSSRNPYTGDIIAHYPQQSVEQIDDNIRRLQKRFLGWKNTPVAERVEILRHACQYFDVNRDAIAKDITEAMGKPLAQSKNELNGFFERANYLLDNAETFLADEIISADSKQAQIISHAPFGVVLIVAAWNYPLLIAINGVLTALLAGNTVLLKHASNTIVIGQHFQRAFGLISGHEELLLHCVAEHSVLANVMAQSNINHVVFTGSVAAGEKVYQHSAKQFNHCHLELGGKDAAYVDEGIDVDQVAASLVDGAMYNAGQSCCGIERVYVHHSLYSQFIDACNNLIAKYRLGDPMDETTDMGPLASASAAEAMDQQIQNALSLGAEIVIGGESTSINGATFFNPTLLKHVTNQMLVMQEENFGPILPVMSVQNMQQAITLINDNVYGLTAAIYSHDQDKVAEFADAVDVGTVFQNRCDYLAPALPWTGCKQSGIGSGLSKFGFYGLTRRKAKNFNKS
ncbi:aldehyde dehydrogenase family protein [Thalassotalea sp. Y01]|uniref:aldehyde dehydrogenase family protein n=1 Tax=Thalassotalea sp. Y01 TaxID=2729613 RepID=UPI00145DC4E5|nr:aldehyde dehydrogenase family protein [Thalassotalea sp. Y01]NMP16357.1 aldehyde dehydrogenase family protein [Thalassotalea sp. Y01]